MDLKFSEDSINNTVGARRGMNQRPFMRQLFSGGSSGGLGRGTIVIVRTIVNGCSPALIRGAADPTKGGQEPIRASDS